MAKLERKTPENDKMQGQLVHDLTCQLQTGVAGGRHGGQGEKSWPACSDEDLLVRYAREGIREAFEELVHRYERELFSHLRKDVTAAA